MGSFNKRCVLSGSVIRYEDNIAVWLIQPTVKDMSMVWKHDAVAPPVFGKYDDYGALEDIREDSNTKQLEEFFDLDIKTLINVVERIQCRGFLEEYNSCCVVLEHYADFDFELAFNTYDLLNNVVGFGFTTDEDGLYYHPDEPNVKVEFVKGVKGKSFDSSSMDHFILKDSDGTEYKAFYLSNVVKFVEKMSGNKKYLGISDENQDKVKVLSKLKLAYAHEGIYLDLLKMDLSDDITYKYDMENFNGIMADIKNAPETKKIDLGNGKVYDLGFVYCMMNDVMGAKHILGSLWKTGFCDNKQKVSDMIDSGYLHAYHKLQHLMYIGGMEFDNLDAVSDFDTDTETKLLNIIRDNQDMLSKRWEDYCNG